MDAIHPCCAGFDVHKDSVAACARWRDADGQRCEDIKTFGTMTHDLLALSDWLAQRQVTHVAMESTGVYWKPIFNILEGCFHLLLVNARHIKQVPGRKSDVKDCQWIAQLLEHGLLTSSFVPDRPQRELRDLTRHRAQVVSEHTRVSNRIQKVLEDCNIKLASVASDALGKSGRDMIQALLAGDASPAEMARLARGRLQKKTHELEAALTGHVTEHHRFLLQMLWDHLIYLEGVLYELDRRIEEQMHPFAETIDRLDGIPGVDVVTAQALIAEVGTDMSRFPTADHLTSWAGLAPGSHESAGKRKSGKTTKGNRWLKRCLSQAAWGAAKTKDTYLSAQFRQIARRRGRKRAIIAVARTILVIAYCLLARGGDYQELGADYFETLRPDKLRRYYTKRLENLGYHVILQEADEAA